MTTFRDIAEYFGMQETYSDESFRQTLAVYAQNLGDAAGDYRVVELGPVKAIGYHFSIALRMKSNANGRLRDVYMTGYRESSIRYGFDTEGLAAAFLNVGVLNESHYSVDLLESVLELTYAGKLQCEWAKSASSTRATCALALPPYCYERFAKARQKRRVQDTVKKGAADPRAVLMF